jgi:hypothetical protein
MDNSGGFGAGNDYCYDRDLSSAYSVQAPVTAVRNVAVIPHSFCDGPGLLAAIHVTAALGYLAR